MRLGRERQPVAKTNLGARRSGRPHEVTFADLTSSAHIRSVSSASARVGAPKIYTLAIFIHLEVLTFGIRIAIPSIDPEFARRRTSMNIVLEGT
jgi:hypothetical protein